MEETNVLKFSAIRKLQMVNQAHERLSNRREQACSL